jgi:creatinine amidohydrolase
MRSQGASYRLIIKAFSSMYVANLEEISHALEYQRSYIADSKEIRFRQSYYFDMHNLSMGKNSENLLELMNAAQIRTKVNGKTVVLLVFGACENHGDHMPFGSDFIFPLEVAKKVAKRIDNIIVLPAVPYGVSTHHKGFKMTISLQSDTLVKIIFDIISSLIANNIKRILIINGHDGNIGPIESAARSVKDSHPEVILSCLESWWTLVGTIRHDLFDVWNGLGHGGEAETSGMLAVHPELVNMDLAPQEVIPKIPNDVRIYWNFDELTRTGATGSPRKASIEKGNKLLKTVENVLISFIQEMEQNNWKYGIMVGQNRKTGRTITRE